MQLIPLNISIHTKATVTGYIFGQSEKSNSHQSSVTHDILKIIIVFEVKYYY